MFWRFLKFFLLKRDFFIQCSFYHSSPIPHCPHLPIYPNAYPLFLSLERKQATKNNQETKQDSTKQQERRVKERAWEICIYMHVVCLRTHIHTHTEGSSRKNTNPIKTLKSNTVIYEENICKVKKKVLRQSIMRQNSSKNSIEFVLYWPFVVGYRAYP